MILILPLLALLAGDPVGRAALHGPLLERAVQAGTWQPGGVDHPALHPGQNVSYFEVHDLARVGEAYAEAPIFQFLRDPEVLGLLEQLGGPELSGEQVSPQALFALAMDSLAAELPDAVRWLEEVRRISTSTQLSESTLPLVGELIRYGLASEELEELDRRWQDHARLQGTAPADLASLVADDPQLGLDPWGRPYVATVEADLGHRITCFGSDGVAGGEGTAADLIIGLVDQPAFQAAVLQQLIDSVGIQVVVEFTAQAAAEEALQHLSEALDFEGPKTQPLTIEGLGEEGLQISVEEQGLRIDGWAVVHGTTLVLGGLANRPEHLVARLGGGPSLAQAADFRAAAAALPSPSGTPIVDRFEHWTQWGLVLDVVRLAIEAGALEQLARDSDEAPSAWIFEALLAQCEVDRRPLLRRTELQRSTFVTETVRLGPPARPAAIVERPVDRALFDLVGDEASLVWTTEVDFVALYERVMALGASARGQTAEQLHRQIQERLGLDPRSEFLAYLGQRLVVSLDPIRGIGTPRLMAFVELEDPAAATAGLTRLAQSLGQAFPNEVSTNVTEYRGMPLARLEVREVETGPVSLEPSFGILGNRLVCGLSAAHVKGVRKDLTRLESGELAAHPLRDSSRVSIPEHATTLFYADWAGMVAAAYNTGRTLASMAGSESLGVPVDLDDLPSGDLFTRYFGPSLTVSHRTAAGERSTSRGPFGPEFSSTSLQALSSLLTLSVGTTAERSYEVARGEPIPETPDPEVQGDPVAQSHASLRRVRIALQIHYLEMGGKYPKSLDALAEPTPNFPRGSLDGDPLPADGWGRPLHYRPAPDAAAYSLWSLGPDGLDQGGAGDDLAVSSQ
jgi:hypothetical protein